MRFTVKGDRLYAIVLGWPEDGKPRIKSLARNSHYLPSEITKVEMLGADTPLSIVRTAEPLVITVPAQRPNDIAYCFGVSPSNL